MPRRRGRKSQRQTSPPIHLIFDSTTYYITDGHHRYHAAKQAGLTELPCVITEGTLRDATLAAVQANTDHGIRRTNADKRKAVMMLLGDEEWAGWSNREIARRCKVHSSMVDDFRKKSLPNSGSEPSTYTTKHGTVATMNTVNIGRSATSSTESSLPDRRIAAKEASDENDRVYGKLVIARSLSLAPPVLQRICAVCLLTQVACPPGLPAFLQATSRCPWYRTLCAAYRRFPWGFAGKGSSYLQSCDQASWS